MRTFATLLLIFAATGRAEIKLPHLFGDHMVIQRDRPVHIWGDAQPQGSVTVAFRGESRSAQSSPQGRWSVFLRPGAAGGPYELTVTGENQVVVHDIVVGDIWIASGQSNMEMQLSRTENAESAAAAANLPQLRFMKMARRVSDYPLPDGPTEAWRVFSPQTVGQLSAAAYYFARDLHEHLGVPVGIVESNWGGTPAEAWTSLGALSSDASLTPVFASWAHMMDGQYDALEAQRKKVAQWEASGKKGDRPWSPNQENSWKPGGLFNAMIAPLTPFPIRGVIWYQGESNAGQDRAHLYAHLFQTMIGDWRRAWGQGNFPFLFVQLANFTAGGDGGWPTVREAQRQTLELDRTGMAVTIDIGDVKDIHPKDKKDVGLRLALAARSIEYGEKIEYSGPRFRQATAAGDKVVVWFEHAEGLHTKDGSPRGFEIAGPDGKFKPAAAQIDGATVSLSSAEVTNPVSVRYGWADNPDCNLYNNAELPASPFTSR